MFLLRKPTPAEVEFLLDRADASEFSYSQLGATESEVPPGFQPDHNRIEIGQEQDWERAKTALRDWRMFDIGWIELYPIGKTPIEAGRTVAILIHHFGFHSLNFARIVYTIDEPTRFGFAYGTLVEHGESGEERFLVEKDIDTGRVVYDLRAFSRPNHLFAKLGHPVVRHLQKRFAADSLAAMFRAVRDNRLN